MVKLAVVRVRGSVKVRREVLDTLRMLGLTRLNHCVVVEDTPSIRGMLQEAKDYITWGEIGTEALKELLLKRGRLVGNKKLTEDYVRANTRFSSIQELARAVVNGEAELPKILPELKKVFRLHPPSKGHGSIKRPFKFGGALGYRGKEIDKLIARMV